jgi:squalene synthase HpnC
LPNRFLVPKDFIGESTARTRRWSREESLAYTNWLAHHHYENFHVVSFLLPKHLHQDFYNVYAFCRWADDLADEIDDTGRSLELLAWWKDELEAMYTGEVRHPVFVALQGTVLARSLPREPFADLIRAFVQDQTVTRYQTFEEIYAYCRYSANPVGRLVLGLCGYSDPERFALSDATCTGLQLANFWQDVTVDWEKDRVYLPLEVLKKHGSSVEDIRQRRATPGFMAAMREAVDVAERHFLDGLPLARMVNRRLSIDLELFSRGGMRVLDKIRAQDYDVLRQRPVISKLQRVGLLLTTLARVAVRRAA